MIHLDVGLVFAFYHAIGQQRCKKRCLDTQLCQQVLTDAGSVYFSILHACWNRRELGSFVDIQTIFTPALDICQQNSMNEAGMLE